LGLWHGTPLVDLPCQVTAVAGLLAATPAQASNRVPLPAGIGGAALTYGPADREKPTWWNHQRLCVVGRTSRTCQPSLHGIPVKRYLLSISGRRLL
jgi:hypothetical protein